MIDVLTDNEKTTVKYGCNGEENCNLILNMRKNVKKGVEVMKLKHKSKIEKIRKKSA